jgi:hypothetical protein
MKKTLLLLFLALAAPCRAQEIALNDSLSVRVRPLTREEYTARKAAACEKWMPPLRGLFFFCIDYPPRCGGLLISPLRG